ncbi:FCD domain-containing protein [Ureibacillus xyleni]|uniref:FCD domain-containing protein n=1 Tax=Ureibacillus xyleni TaxID=614648 RepID=A0A285TQM5_9BACL|nr:FCD domain-containing protein [Ureibacillus xyleni]SOC25325.1 FCD domain-containing protein [Ureibacillus xyleni]
MTQEDIDELKGIYLNMLDAGYSNNIKNQIELDNEFHRKIVYACKKDALIRVWETMCIPFWTYLGTQLFNSQKEDLVPRHYPIVEAIEANDKQLACDLIKAHFFELKELI